MHNLKHKKMIEYVSPNSAISMKGINEITTLLQCECDMYLDDIEKMFDVLGIEWKSKFGTLTKRIARYVYKNHSIKISSDVLTLLGNHAADNASKEEIFNFEYYSINEADGIDWYRGAYGDDGSCFWSENEEVQDLMKDYDFFAFRFYDRNDCGIARCWGRKVENNFVIFNAYGPYRSIELARIISGYLGISYRGITLYNNGDDSGLLYINSGHGQLLGPWEKIKDIEKHDFRINEYEYISEENTVTCDECGELIHEDNSYWGYLRGEERLLCQCCVDDSYKRLYHNNELHHEDDIYKTPYGYELHDDVQHLEYCDEYIPVKELFIFKGETLCKAHVQYLFAYDAKTSELSLKDDWQNVELIDENITNLRTNMENLI